MVCQTGDNASEEEKMKDSEDIAIPANAPRRLTSADSEGRPARPASVQTRLGSHRTARQAAKDISDKRRS